jgi:hypothetical protein
MPSPEMPATSGDSTQRLAARAPLPPLLPPLLPIAAVVDTECDPGQEALAWRRLSALAATGCDIEAFTIDASRAFEVKLQNEGMVVRRLGRQHHADWPSVRDLATAARHSQHRAIYCMGPRAHARAVVAASMLQVPAVIHPYAIPSFGDLSIARTTGATLFVATGASLGHARLAGCDALLVRAPVGLEPCERLEPSDRKTLHRPRCVGWIGAWRDANNPALFERAAEAIGRERHDLAFVMVALGASPPRASSGSRITVVTAEEFDPGHLAKIGVLVHTGFDDGCPIGWMEAYVRGMSLVLPVDGFVDAFVRASEAHFYSSGYLNELIVAIDAAVDSSAQSTPGSRQLDASAGSSASIRTALDQVVSRG